ncbi:hypothetical protein [Desulfovibrio sp. Huiquan2017]|uniref:hypothetical protein n=1 Tax=Desulfovibrio sp. Huiquan2017 TaxID=2816861 RepID=UPI001A91E0AD|nr:hypothetical protein [Desulfovibrio sp. Huiquan2017]
MSIRYNLLILLLFISLVPLLGIGTVVRRDIFRLGANLAKRSENVLIHKADDGLTPIVRERAQVPGRERQLFESTTLFYDPALDLFEELDGDGFPLGGVKDGGFELRERAKPSPGSVVGTETSPPRS